MATVLIGQEFVFQILFTDAIGAPIVVADATIHVFRYDSNGTKVTLVPADPGEVGRYLYTYSVPSSLTRGDTIYGDMEGTVAADTQRKEQDVDLLSPTDAGSGLIAQFINGG
jgi:hypothetical protein